VASNLWLDRDYPKDFQHVTFLDNHDLPRLHSICSERDAMQALFFQFSIRGLPMLTYGTEHGLKGDKEPLNRADMPWGVEGRLSDMITKLVTLRRENPVLERGVGFVDRLDENVFIYTQYLDGAAATVAINRGKKPIAFSHSLSNCFEATDTFQPCQGKKIRPHSTRMWLWKKKQPSPQKRTVTFDVYPCKDQDLRIVGSAMELGGWNPHKGLRLKESKGRCQAKLNLEKNAILRFKIVEVTEKEVKWKEGPDQILWKKRTFSAQLED
ncbi:MAG: carbohydrate-binding module family 20 domain-containing protein, partial [Myxococcota bacterium]|nr:carbohydrate-binding module family 20 domain-containing protein [Myxococcota bacterium]